LSSKAPELEFEVAMTPRHHQRQTGHAYANAGKHTS
jgi:hypothetical protein